MDMEPGIEAATQVATAAAEPEASQPPAPEVRRPRRSAAEVRGALLGLLSRHRAVLPAVVVGTILPLITAAAAGALSIPHNDAWAYSRIAQHFADTGHLVLLGWNRSALLGQFLPLGPLASSLAVQQLFVVLLGLIALLSVYDLLRPSVGSRNAGLAAFCLALWPGFALLTTSFMTDVPAMCAIFLCLALGRRALDRDSVLLFSLAALAGFWGTTIRAQSVAAPVALLLYTLLSYRKLGLRRLRLPLILGYAVAMGIAFLLFNKWFESLPGGDLPPYKLVPQLLQTALNTGIKSYFTIALPAAPAVFWAARPWLWRTSAKVTSVLVAVIAVMALHDYHAAYFFTGNYLAQSGAYSATTLGSHLVIHDTTWHVLVAVAMLSGALLAGLIVERARFSDKLVATFTVLFAGGTLATFLLGEDIFDRYLVELVPCLLAIALMPQPEKEEAEARLFARVPKLRVVSLWTRAAAACAACLVVISLAATLLSSALSIDSQRWNTAKEIQAQGVPAMRIDAGLEWLGFHSPHGVINRSSDGNGPVGYFTTTPACFEFTVSPVSKPGWQLFKTVEYKQFIVGGSAKLYVYETGATGCGAYESKVH